MVRQIHITISAALSAAVRWEWVKTNPADVARTPKPPATQPDPPTPERAAQITAAWWEQVIDAAITLDRHLDLPTAWTVADAWSDAPELARSHRTGDDTVALKSAQSDAAPETKLDAAHLCPAGREGLGRDDPAGSCECHAAEPVIGPRRHAF